MTDAVSLDEAVSRLTELVSSAPSPGEFGLEFTGGVSAPAQPWVCVVEVDLRRGHFEEWGETAYEAVVKASVRLRELLDDEKRGHRG